MLRMMPGGWRTSLQCVGDEESCESRFAFAKFAADVAPIRDPDLRSTPGQRKCSRFFALIDTTMFY
jgi:hypothetical protein